LPRQNAYYHAAPLLTERKFGILTSVTEGGRSE
jgi:hypothetical protein